MEKKREFRRDYTSLNKNEKFICGDIATVIEKRTSEVQFKVNGTPYLLPVRDFIVVTKPIK
jgi:hypothetical protein